MLQTFLVSGLIYAETQLALEQFPMSYRRVRYSPSGIERGFAGPAYNVMRALTALGSSTRLLALTGDDQEQAQLLQHFEQERVLGAALLSHLESTPQAVVARDSEGKEQIIIDLKDLQQQQLAPGIWQRMLEQSGPWCLLSSLNYLRPLLNLSKDQGKKIAVDLHAIQQVDDDYHREFIQQADIIFASAEHSHYQAEQLMAELQRSSSAQLIVVSQAEHGCWLWQSEQQQLEHFATPKLGKVLQLHAAGDTLFACFMHFYQQQYSASKALQLALLFTAHKLSQAQRYAGYLSEPELLNLAVDMGIK